MVIFISGGLRLEFLTSVSNTNSVTIDVPDTVEAGDFILLFDCTRRVLGTPTKTIPTDFTEIVDTLGTFGSPENFWRQLASGKIADADDAGSTLTGLGGDAASADQRKTLVVFRANKALSSFSVKPVAPNEEATAGNPTAQSLVTGDGVLPLIAFGLYSAITGPVDPRTFTISGNDAKDDEILADATALAYRIVNRSSQAGTITVDMDDEGVINVLQSFWIEFT